MKTSIQYLDGKSSEWLEKDWINDRMTRKIRSSRRRVAWFKEFHISSYVRTCTDLEEGMIGEGDQRLMSGQQTKHATAF